MCCRRRHCHGKMNCVFSSQNLWTVLHSSTMLKQNKKKGLKGALSLHLVKAYLLLKKLGSWLFCFEIRLVPVQDSRSHWSSCQEQSKLSRLYIWLLSFLHKVLLLGQEWLNQCSALTVCSSRLSFLTLSVPCALGLNWEDRCPSPRWV